MQLTNIVRDVQEDLEFDRIYLPQDEITRFGYSEAELRAGVVNDSFTQLMRFQTQRAKHYFRSGFQLLPYLSRRSRACPAVLGQLYQKVLEEIEDADYECIASPGVFKHRAESAGDRPDLADHCPASLAYFA